MNFPTPASGRRLPIALFVLAALAILAIGLGRSSSAPAATNPNNYDCRGGIEKGEVDAETGETEVRYIFACNGPITGFQVQPQIEATGYDTEVFGQDAVTKQVDGANDAFSCNGDIPGYGINCVGKYKGGYDRVEGKFTIDGDICTEPRVDPLLTVTYATTNAAGAVVQSISGPYDLGRPRKSGCKATKFSGKTRIPRETSEDASNVDVG